MVQGYACGQNKKHQKGKQEDVKKVVKDEKYKDQWRKLGLFKRV